jgi:cytochrome c-type biogenesis protein
MSADLSVFLAFAAGLLSFLSPCVLPLIPSFLSFIGGAEPADDETNENPPAITPSPDGGPEKTRRRGRPIIAGTIFFIAGFGSVFVLLGILFSGPAILWGGAARIINIAAGAVVIVLGFNILFNFLGFLNYEKRFRAGRRKRGLIGSFLGGAAFGAGWSPCVGPILGSILLLAGGSGALGRAVLYLTAYSAGLGLPFLGAALFFDSFLKHIGKLRRWIPLIKRISGIFLIFIGLFIMSGRFRTLNSFFAKSGYALAGWAQSGNLTARLLPAAVFFLIAILPLVFRALKKQSLRSPGLRVFCGVFLLLGAAQAAGLIDCGSILGRWFLYQGI